MHNGGVEAAFAVARRGIRLREKGESWTSNCTNALTAETSRLRSSIPACPWCAAASRWKSSLQAPAVAIDGSTVKVQVGEVEHPMMDAHYIQLIVLVTEKGYQVAPLTPADKPVATFALAEGDAPVKVYEHCNLHGLWVKEL